MYSTSFGTERVENEPVITEPQKTWHLLYWEDQNICNKDSLQHNSMDIFKQDERDQNNVPWA